MIEIYVPGYEKLSLRYLVLDYNGTIARDGHLISGVSQLLTALSEKLDVHIVTADTFEKAKAELENLPLTLEILPEAFQDEAKCGYVQSLESAAVVAIGNGRNDRLMLKEAGLGVAVVQGEGAAFGTLAAADVVCPDILLELELLLNPTRLIATLRS